ncbi:MAG: FAD-binding oxidoreductase [Acidobacteria bacterium]|nr:FAD-binding oxidoreductase [Acidobacteriota bacterium]MDW7984960.1 FAD-linked oxidase C-terminal domain-containing protein [Acidobacteriota bacterium]
MKKRRLIRELVRIVGKGGVIVDPVERRVYETDGLTVFQATPDVVVLPRTAEQVARIVQVCAREGIPFVARGAGTGLSGGALPLVGGVLIALNRMDRILEVDYPNLRAIVEPGVINARLGEVLASRGYYYAPDPASQTACTIGGNVAENSGGPRTPKYGVTTHHVLGLEVVLPDGEILSFGGKVPDVPGYDFVGLLVGSEGTLGIVTKVIVRILRKPEAVRTLMAVFETVEDASNAVSAIVAQGIIPVAIEMMDNLSIQAVEKGVAAGYPLDAGAVLLIELDGPRAEVEALVEPVLEICRAWRVRTVRVAQTEEERLRFWKGRKAAFASMGQLSSDYYVQDAVIPRTRLPAIMKRIEELSHQYGLRVANVFHAGDGNLHPLILFDARQPGALQKAEALGAEILRACVELGGSLTGEHGIGLEKRDYMPLMFRDEDLAAMQKVKRVFDPRGLLNPGKIFPRDYLSDPSLEPNPGPPSVGTSLERPSIPGRLTADLGHIIGLERVGGSLEAPQYNVDGQTPRLIAWPRKVEEVPHILALARQHDLKVIPWGGGTMVDLGRPPLRVDLALDLSDLNGVVDYEPADMTASFRAGTTLRDAQALLAAHGQFIPLDPPGADRATLGGILATAASGPWRHRYGTPRDLVLAVQVVHADGTVTRGGAKVVKNVAGYDMPKLYIGSLGTLGVIVEVTLRVYPRPAVEATCLMNFDDVTAVQAAIAGILDAPLVPTAVELLNPTAMQVVADQVSLPVSNGQYGLAVAFGSPWASAVNTQVDRVRTIGRAAGARSETHLTGEPHDRFWQVVRDFPRDRGDVVLKVGVPIAEVGAIVTSAEGMAQQANLRLSIVGEAGVGILRFYIPADVDDPARFLSKVDTLIRSLRVRALSLGGYLVVLAAPVALKARVDVWGAVPDPVFRLMTRLKKVFDPYQILNPGRFVEGI